MRSIHAALPKIHIFSAFYRLLLRDSHKNVMPQLAMQIVCPNCTTAYEIPDAVFGGRARKLRCESCGTQWKAGPPGGEEAPDPSYAPESYTAEPAVLPEEPPQPPGRVFGQAADPSLQAEIREAMDRERAAPPPPPPPPVEHFKSETAPDPDDPFINLVLAARSRAIEFEPEPPPERRFKIPSTALIGGLLTLFVLAVAFLLFHARKG